MISIRNKTYTKDEIETLEQAIIIGMNGIPCKSIDCHSGLSDCPSCEHQSVCKDLIELVHYIASLKEKDGMYKCTIVLTDEYDSENSVEYSHNDSITIHTKVKE